MSLVLDVLGSDFAGKLSQYSNGDTLKDFVTGGLYVTRKIGLILIPIFVFLNIGWAFLSNSVSSVTGKKVNVIDFGEIARVIALLFLFTVYLPFINLFQYTVRTVSNVAKPSEAIAIARANQAARYRTFKMKSAGNENSSEKATVLYGLTQKGIDDDTYQLCYRIAEKNGYLDEALKAVEGKSSSDVLTGNVNYSKNPGVNYDKENKDKKTGWLGKLKEDWRSFRGKMITAEISSVAILARPIIGYLSVALTKLLIVLGPLAIVFSILPMFKDKLEDWFGTLILVAFAVMTLNIIDYLAAFYMSSMIENINKGYVNEYGSLALEITIMICYVMVFWLTGKYVGKADAGKFISKAVGITTGAVLMGMKAGLGAMSAAGTGGAGAGAAGGSGLVNTMTSKVNDAIKKTQKSSSESGDSIGG